MLKSLIIVLISLTICSASFANPDHPYSKNRLIVKLDKGQNVPSHPNILSSRRLFKELYVVRTDKLLSVEKFLQDRDEVLYVERDYIADTKKLPTDEKTLAPLDNSIDSFFNDPLISRLWAFKFSSRSGISVEQSYQEGLTNAHKTIIVAVVDTGVDYNHADLKDVMWTNSDEIPGNGIDDDNNGYIDDIHGINTLIRNSEGDATVNIMDTHSHGTHVSGTIGATQNNNIGIAGIASNVKIMGIRTVPNSSDEKDVDVIEAFIYAAKNGAKIINCSFGKSHNEGGMAVSEAIDFIGSEYGVLVVAASGNSSQNIDQRLTYPASFSNENLLVVASTTSSGRMSYFSNYGIKNVDVAAPGSSIYSTTPRNRYSSMSGTSMASPTTAGVAAEVLSNFPELTPVELKTVLMESVTKVSAFQSKIKSAGRVDLKQALLFAKERF